LRPAGEWGHFGGASTVLRPAHENARVLERPRQLAPESGRVSGFEPSPDTVRGRREQDVGACRDDGVRVQGDLRVVVRRRNVDGGRVQHLGAAALEPRDEILRAAIRCDADPETLELVGAETRERRVIPNVGHGVSVGGGSRQ